jgi:hypothetical protein
MGVGREVLDWGWRENSCEDCNYVRGLKAPYRLEYGFLALVPVQHRHTVMPGV